MKILAVTNMWPSRADPSLGAFVVTQIDSLRRLGIEVSVLHADREADGRAVYRTLADRVRRSVEAEAADVVHVMYGGVMADVVTRAVKTRPVLVSFCGTDILGGVANTPLARVATAYGVRASRRAARRADGVVVKSRSLLAALPGGLAAERVWVVPNGVDFELFRPLDREACRTELGWDASRKQVLFTADTRRPEKRFDLAEAAFERLASMQPDVELRVLDGIKHATVPTWLNAVDVVLLTSVHEGSPNVVKEALACNVAVVSVDVGDVRERVDGIDGCYVAEATPEDLAVSLHDALDRDGRIDARDRVRDLSLENVARTLAAVYAQLAAAEGQEP
jgi:teichuronic acid biosynthesis glycosyltransferase TuaC